MNPSGHMTNKKRYISIFTSPVATKSDRMVAYDKEPKLQSQMFFASPGHVSARNE